MNDYKIKKGKWGEELAAEYLKKSGYKIIERNFRSKWGEIDIIAAKDGVLHIIEVKARSNDNFGSPLSAINHEKLKHIARSAQHYIYINQLYEMEISYDGIGICGEEIEYIKGLWI